MLLNPVVSSPTSFYWLDVVAQNTSALVSPFSLKVWLHLVTRISFPFCFVSASLGCCFSVFLCWILLSFVISNIAISQGSFLFFLFTHVGCVIMTLRSDSQKITYFFLKPHISKYQKILLVLPSKYILILSYQWNIFSPSHGHLSLRLLQQ